MIAGLTNIDIFTPEIVYSGVWQKNPDGSVGAYWNRTSAEFRTDSKNLRVEFVNSNAVHIAIDDVRERYVIEGDKVDLKLDGKLHKITIIGRYDDVITLKAILVDEGAEILKPEKRPYFQFIGDSISHFASSFSFNTPEMLGVDYSVVAQAGASLHDGWGWYPMPEGMTIRKGMESSYYYLEFPHHTNKRTQYTFEICRVPDVIVFHLGTNDYLSNEKQKNDGHMQIFADAYKNFVGRLRERFPNVRIYIIEPFTDPYCRSEGVQLAAKVSNEKYGDVHFIPTKEWEIEISEDGTHPTPEGFKVATVKLAEFLKNDLKGILL